MVKEIKNCSIEHCEREAKSKGFCGRHYQSLWKYGDPLYVEKNGGSKEIKNKPLSYEGSHKFIDDVEHKLCRECNEWHPMNKEYFYVNKSNTDGYNTYCKSCCILRSSKWKNNNRDKVRVSDQKYNKSKRGRERANKWGKKVRDSGRYREWLRNNKDKVKNNRERWESNNKHEITERERKYCKQYFNYECAYCGMTEEKSKKVNKQRLHMDHVDCDGANDLSNNIPACRSCNSSKHQDSLEEWYSPERVNFFSEDRLNKIYNWLSGDYEQYIEDKDKSSLPKRELSPKLQDLFKRSDEIIKKLKKEVSKQ
ncbi:HNH endonuclease [Metabacillus sp. Hm71]|uniref:HNH endonuclease n=1 Tax=Metabacillus sp. Hm71 TaxID=3450743 RepID=UPI003F42B4D5